MEYYFYKNDIEFIILENETVSYQEHNHSTMYVMGIVLAGNVDVCMKEIECSYTKNQYFIIPLLAMHTMRIEDKLARLLLICIKESFLERDRGNGFSILMEGINLIKQVHAADVKVVVGNAYKELRKMHADKRDILSEEISILKQSIVCDSQRVLSIDNLAKQACFSKEYFIRKFKKDIGMPPHHYVLQNRIRFAQKLLQQNIPIADVATETGFYDQSHFLKAFRQIVGITPKEYKSAVHVLE